MPTREASRPRRCFGTCSGATALVVVMAAFQFWHWFRPSEPYLVDILSEDMGVPSHVVYNEIFPWSTYALLPATLLSAIIFEVFGFGSALLLAAVGDVVTVLLVVGSGGAMAMLLASQLTFALSFAAVFTSVATLFALLPPELYQRASSYNRAASLLGTILSSLVGQALQSAGLRWDTLWGTVTGTSVSLVIIIAALGARVLRPHALADAPAAQPAALDRVAAKAGRPGSAPAVAAAADDTAAAPASETEALAEYPLGSRRGLAALDDAASVASSDGSSLWGIAAADVTPTRIADRMRKVARSAARSYSSPAVFALSLWSAGLRASHTLALTYWQSLLDMLRPEHNGSGNGAIYAVAYLCAAAAACLPVVAEWVSKSEHPACAWLRARLSCCCWRSDGGVSAPGVAGFAVACMLPATALGAMAAATSVELAAGAFVVFHASSEALMVVASAWIGKTMVAEQGLLPAAAAQGGASRGSAHAAGPSDADSDSDESDGPSTPGARQADEAALGEEEALRPDEVGSLRWPGQGAGAAGSGGRARPLLSDSGRAGAPARERPRRAGKGVYFAAVLGCNALVGMLVQVAVQAGVQSGGNPLRLQTQFAVFAGVIAATVVLGLAVVSGAACCCGAGSKPSGESLRLVSR